MLAIELIQQNLNTQLSMTALETNVMAVLTWTMQPTMDCLTTWHGLKTFTLMKDTTLSCLELTFGRLLPLLRQKWQLLKITTTCKRFREINNNQLIFWTCSQTFLQGYPGNWVYNAYWHHDCEVGPRRLLNFSFNRWGAWVSRTHHGEIWNDDLFQWPLWFYRRWGQ